MGLKVLKKPAASKFLFCRFIAGMVRMLTVMLILVIIIIMMII